MTTNEFSLKKRQERQELDYIALVLFVALFISGACVALPVLGFAAGLAERLYWLALGGVK